MTEPLILAVPKGRILEECLPLLAAVGIVPEPAFADPESRALRFRTNSPAIDLIRVRAFDVATFVAHGAAQLGIVGSDVLAEFAYSELYAPVDLGIGHCRISVAEPADMAEQDDPRGWSHVRIATKYPHITRAHFEARGVQAECVKLNGAMELAPVLGLAPRIVDLGLVGAHAQGKRAGRSRGDCPGHLAPRRQPRCVQDARGRSRAPGRRLSEGRRMIRLDASKPGFDTAFTQLVNARREADEDVARNVTHIIKRVQAEGDAALRDLTRLFDKHDLDATGWKIDRADCLKAWEELTPELRDALELAAERIAAYHAKQRPEDSEHIDAQGIRLGARWTAVDAAGIYVPGGRAAYPSSVLMNALPARAAGVGRLVMVTPTPNGEINPLVLAAAHIAGVDEIWRVGGAQAVAALAYGTDSIAPVDVITGPGNAWVAEAKRQLYGVVGIDMVAGPSEIVVVADAANDPEWIAADLLSQAEHDPTSQSILFTDDAAFADTVAATVERQIAELATAATARASWDANGAIILVPTLGDAVPLVDRLAPEHLELACDQAEALFQQVRHAGSIFIGRLTPEAIGDYVAGPNHVLPTGRRARFASGLSVLDFMKRTSFLRVDQTGLAAIGPAAVALANAEGLPAHAKSVALRLGEGDAHPDLHDDGWCLESGLDRHLLHPESFEIPGDRQRAGLRAGDFAKLIFVVQVEDDEPAVERMWVVVREVVGDTYFGLLDNEPAVEENDEFWVGTEIPFGPEHVIEIQGGDPASVAYAARTPLRNWPRV